MRDDVVSELVLALIEGRAMRKDAAVAARTIISRRFTDYHNKFGTLSLDELRGDGEGVAFIDLIPDTQRLWA